MVTSMGALCIDCFQISTLKDQHDCLLYPQMGLRLIRCYIDAQSLQATLINVKFSDASFYGVQTGKTTSTSSIKDLQFRTQYA